MNVEQYMQIVRCTEKTYTREEAARLFAKVQAPRAVYAKQLALLDELCQSIRCRTEGGELLGLDGKELDETTRRRLLIEFRPYGIRKLGER